MTLTEQIIFGKISHTAKPPANLHHETLKPFTINYELLGRLIDWQKYNGIVRDFGIKRGLVKTRKYVKTCYILTTNPAQEISKEDLNKSNQKS